MKETMMRMMLLGLLALSAVFGDVRPSEARPWRPWCAVYADRSGVEECLFATFAQCQATVSGIGGFCRQNLYPPRSDRRRHGHNDWWPFYPD